MSPTSHAVGHAGFFKDALPDWVATANGKDWTLKTIPGMFLSLEAISINPGCIDLFALAESKTIYHRTWKEGFWEEWEDLKGIMTKPPKAVSHLPGVVGVFSIGETGSPFFKVRDAKSGAWGEWISMGGIIVTKVG